MTFSHGKLSQFVLSVGPPSTKCCLNWVCYHLSSHSDRKKHFLWQSYQAAQATRNRFLCLLLRFLADSNKTLKISASLQNVHWVQLLTSCLSQYKRRQLSFPVAHSQVPALQAETVPVALDNWCLLLAPALSLLEWCCRACSIAVLFSWAGWCFLRRVEMWGVAVILKLDFSFGGVWITEPVQEPVATWLPGRWRTPGHKTSCCPEAEPSRLISEASWPGNVWDWHHHTFQGHFFSVSGVAWVCGCSPRFGWVEYFWHSHFIQKGSDVCSDKLLPGADPETTLELLAHPTLFYSFHAL